MLWKKGYTGSTQRSKTMGTLFFFGYLMIGVAIYGVWEYWVENNE
jgi:hypothetical protein